MTGYVSSSHCVLAANLTTPARLLRRAAQLSADPALRVAELGSAFLCVDLDMTPEIREDHAAYIASWLKALKNDKRLIFSAAAHAQRAVDYLHGPQAKAEQQENREKRTAAAGGPRS